MKKIKGKMAWVPFMATMVGGVGLAACSPGSHSGSAAFSQAAAERLSAENKPHEAANAYARLGELLIAAGETKPADEMFGKALALESDHSIANLYKAGTEPVLALRSIERPSDRQLTRHELQRALKENVLPVVVASAERIARIQLREPVSIFLSPRDMDPKTLGVCTHDASEGWQCARVADASRRAYSADADDLKLLRSAWSSMADQIRIATAYSLKGSERALRRLSKLDAAHKEDGDDGITSREVAQTLRSYPALLTLEPDQELSAISGTLAESMRNALEVAEVRNAVCADEGQSQSFFAPVCVSEEIFSSLRLGVDLLSGAGDLELGVNAAGEPVRVRVDLASWLRRPPRDLKSLLPTAFDEQGEPTAEYDPTYGGLFPNGDLVAQLKTVKRF